MVVTVSGIQEQLLSRGAIEPKWLVTMRDGSGSVLRFTNNNAFTYQGEHFQPYIVSVGNFTTTANFPENKAGSSSITLEFENTQYNLDGTDYPYLTRTMDTFRWELADCDVDLLLTSGTNTSGTINREDRPIAMPVMTSGIVGTPQRITREGFSVPVTTRNTKLKDLIPLRVVSKEDFPEADPDEVNGRTYLPIVVGSGIRVRAISTTAGATTTVRTEVSAGTTLEVSDTTGFNNGDGIIIGGQTSQIFTIGTVDHSNKEFTSISPNLNTLGVTFNVGDVVIEDKSDYDYTIADHEIGSLDEVYVYRRGEDKPILVDPADYSLVHVADSDAIGGNRAVVRINQLLPIGGGTDGSVTQQPDHTVDGGNHNHNVGLTGGETVTITYANSTSPGGASTANDGNQNTGYFMTGGSATDEFTYTSWPDLSGNFVEYRMRVVTESVLGGAGKSTDIRHGAGTNLLSISNPHTKGEFRTSSTSAGSETTTNRIIVVGDPSSATCFEGWKEVTMEPTVSETTQNLSNTSIIQNVEIAVTGANLEVGEKVEVVVDGLDASDWTSPDLGSGTIDRPDYVARWFLLEALGQTEEVIDTEGYSAAGTRYAQEGISLQLAIQQPITLDKLFDQIANNSRSMHWWGRDGHNLLYLEEASTISGSDFTFEEDTNGVQTIDWQHSISVRDIRNTLTGLYRRDWTKSQTKDEAYTGSVLGQDTDSVAEYGELTNEVRGQEKEVFLDLTTNESQAQEIISFAAGHKAFPRKLFSAQTDWTYLNVEPGDIIDMRPVTANPVYARVVENRVDPRLFCQIEAIEIADSAAHPPEPEPVFNQTASILSADGQFIRNTTNYDYGFGGENADFTVFYRWKQISSTGHTDYFMIDLDDSDVLRASSFIWENEQGGSPRNCKFFLYDQDGSSRKLYQETNFFSGYGIWYEAAITWDDSAQDLRFYESGFTYDSETMTFIPVMQLKPWDVKTEDDTVHWHEGVLHHININRMRGFHLHDCAIWNSVLTVDELSGIIDDQESEYALNNDGTRYQSAANLIKWWRLGFNANDIGEDYANGPGTRVDVIDPDGVGVGPSQIISSAP